MGGFWCSVAVCCSVCWVVLGMLGTIGEANGGKRTVLAVLTCWAVWVLMRGRLCVGEGCNLPLTTFLNLIMANLERSCSFLQKVCLRLSWAHWLEGFP